MDLVERPAAVEQPFALAGEVPDFESLMRSSMAGSQHTTLASLERGDAVLYLSPPAGRYRMLDWAAHEEPFAAGYEHVQAAPGSLGAALGRECRGDGQ